MALSSARVDGIIGSLSFSVTTTHGRSAEFAASGDRGLVCARGVGVVRHANANPAVNVKSRAPRAATRDIPMLMRADITWNTETPQGQRHSRSATPFEHEARTQLSLRCRRVAGLLLEDPPLLADQRRCRYAIKLTSEKLARMR